MTVITAPDNPKLKEIRRLARRASRERSGRFVAEGEDLLAAADGAGWRPLVRVCAAGSGLAGDEVAPELLGSASSLGSGTRTAAVYELRWAAPAGPLRVELHGVGDPGNVGAILRSALAFGASCVVLAKGCADPFGPKAVRASMGAIFVLPVVRADDGESAGRRIALAARAGEPLRGPIEGPLTLLIGAERDGLPDSVLAGADRVAHIPIASESLNAAMAATVALYELTRHRIPAP